MSAPAELARPVMRYHGGKWILAPWIISYFPPHRIYVEPFGGGGSVLMRKPRSYAEVYNDRWHAVINVFRVLRDPEKSEQLRAALELTPYARAEFIDSAHDAEDSDIERARKTIFRSMAGFGSASVNGKYPTGFRAHSNRSGTTPAHDWRNYPDNIPEFVERMRGVTIESREAGEVIAQHDTIDTLFYLDPPYPHSTRNMQRGNAAYEFEMTDADHKRLAHQVKSVKGMVLISGYACPLYERLFRGWARVEREAHADGARDRIEVLWMNPAAANAQRQRALI